MSFDTNIRYGVFIIFTVFLVPGQSFRNDATDASQALSRELCNMESETPRLRALPEVDEKGRSCRQKQFVSEVDPGSLKLKTIIRWNDALSVLVRGFLTSYSSSRFM